MTLLVPVIVSLENRLTFRDVLRSIMTLSCGKEWTFSSIFLFIIELCLYSNPHPPLVLLCLTRTT